MLDTGVHRYMYMYLLGYCSCRQWMCGLCLETQLWNITRQAVEDNPVWSKEGDSQ